ncbi:MAG TPA: hypothetical protein VHC22_19335 [Pirellulales bacterium]|nr:hypothetical protein [Pirellulales bacterium]
MKPASAFIVGVFIGVLLHNSFTPDYRLATTKAEIAARGNGGVINEDHKQRGQQLLAALQEASRSRPWNAPGQGHRMNVSDIVLTYIPVGTPFNEAQDILHYGGMTSGLFLDAPPKPPFMWATGYLFLGLFDNAEVSIQLRARIPGDFTSTVGTVDAIIAYSSL